MINIDNYEGYLYLYQEGELDKATRDEVELFLQQHPDIREEMETYYDPTFVVTAEPPAHKTRRIVPLWRWAAAACVVFALGYGLWATTSTTVGTGNESLVAVNNPIQIQNQPKTSDAPTTDQSSPISSPASANQRIQRMNPSLPSTNKNILNGQPQATDTETTIPIKVAFEPVSTEPTIVYCQLAEEIVPVDNLAEEIIFVDNLAEVKKTISIPEMIIDFSDNRRQQFIDFMKEEFLSRVQKNDTDNTDNTI